MKATLTFLILSFVILQGNNLQAAIDKPLLMEGKKTLYQRVLSVPDARLHQTPDESTEFTTITPFSVLYVYQKDDGWIEVGHDSFGKTAGWVKRDKAIVWNQALTVSFKDPQDIQRVMLFNNSNVLQEMVNNYDKDAYQALYDSVVSGNPPADSPVIAIQPEAHLDIRDNFYLVPIK